MNIVLSLFFLALVLALFLFTLFFVVGRRFIADREKRRPFECGFDPKDSARVPFSMRFFLLAVIFLVFDLEIVLLIPILLLLGKFFSMGSLVSGFRFIIILFLGVLYEWWEGSFK